MLTLPKVIKSAAIRLAVFGLLAFSSVVTAETEKWLMDFSHYVNREALRKNVPGYAFVFYEQGKEPRVFVYGKTKRSGDPITKDTVFRLASVSKTFSGLLAAKLVQQERINWETPISHLAPTIPFKGQGAQTIQLQHILGQSSGFMRNAYDNLIEADYSLERVLTALGKLDPICSPGACYTYQNALFGTLEYYLSNNNSSYHSELHSQLLAPLGMTNASTGRAGLMASDSWAKPHIAIARDRWREGKVENNYYRFAPAAGVNASIVDMTIYLQALLGEFPTVISQEMIDTVTTPRVRTQREINRRGWRGFLKNAHYGLGWRIYDLGDTRINYHGGWVKGYRADVSFSPEYKVGYVMLTNAETNMINTTTAEFWKRFLRHKASQEE